MNKFYLILITAIAALVIEGCLANMKQILLLLEISKM